MWRRVAVQMSVSCVLLLACVAVSDPLEVGTDSVPVQVSADLKVQMGRSDAPMAALRPGSGDSLGAADSFQLYQLGLKAESQYRNLSGKVDLLTTAAPQAWVDYFTAHSLWVREASLTWSQPWGKLSAGRLQYDFGFGVEANADLIPQTGVRFDTRIRGFDVTWLRTDVPDGTNLNPQFVQLFGGYAPPLSQDRIGIFRVTRDLMLRAAPTTLGLTIANTSVEHGNRHSLDLRTRFRDGREMKAIYQMTPKDLDGRRRPDNALMAVTGDLLLNDRWHVQAGWVETGDNYAPTLTSHLFPYGATYDQLVFDRPLFVGCPIPTDSATNPSRATPDYGLMMDGVELDVRYRLTDSSSLRARYMRGDQQNGVTLGEVFYCAYEKALGLGMTAEIGYGHVSTADPFRVGAPGYDMFRIGLTMTDLASTTKDYLRQTGYWHGQTQQ